MAVLKGFDFSNPDAIKDAEDNNQEEHFLRYVKKDETIQVGLLAPTEYAHVTVYDVYPLTGTIGVPTEEDLFSKAKSEMMNLADIAKAEALGLDVKEATDTYKKMSPAEKDKFKKGAGKEWHALISEAYRLDTQERFLFGFYDFETGKPFVMQTTKKQAEGIYKKISDAWTPKKAGAKAEAEKFGYIISKGTGGFAIAVDTDMDIEDKHREWAKQVISEEEFSTAHIPLSVQAQKEVIKQFAQPHDRFNLEKIIGTTSVGEDTKQESPKDGNMRLPLDVTEEELPF